MKLIRIYWLLVILAIVDFNKCAFAPPFILGSDNPFSILGLKDGYSNQDLKEALNEALIYVELLANVSDKSKYRAKVISAYNTISSNLPNLNVSLMLQESSESAARTMHSAEFVLTKYGLEIQYRETDSSSSKRVRLGLTALEMIAQLAEPNSLWRISHGGKISAGGKLQNTIKVIWDAKRDTMELKARFEVMGAGFDKRQYTKQILLWSRTKDSQKASPGMPFEIEIGDPPSKTKNWIMYKTKGERLYLIQVHVIRKEGNKVLVQPADEAFDLRRNRIFWVPNTFLRKAPLQTIIDLTKQTSDVAFGSGSHYLNEINQTEIFVDPVPGMRAPHKSYGEGAQVLTLERRSAPATWSRRQCGALGSLVIPHLDKVRATYSN